jgi:hypothetical protein
MAIASVGTFTRWRGTVNAIDTNGLILMISMDSLAIVMTGAYYMGNENKAVPESRGEG